MRSKRRLTLIALLLTIVALAPMMWLLGASAGHRHEVADAPQAPVVIAFGAELAPGGTRPKAFLAGRLTVAAELVREGRARAVLVSGDAAGSSGDEVTVMTRYLTELGVPPDRIVADRYGLDTYDTCRRARDVFGVRRALLVSQSLHLPRAVTLCRAVGIDADGVAARCDDCTRARLIRNTAREVPASWKAVLDRVRSRPPAVSSPPDPALSRAAAG